MISGPERQARGPALPRQPAPPRGLDTASPLQVLRAMESSPRGLVETEAQARLVRHGENAVPGARQPHWGSRLARVAGNPFLAVLACLAAVSALTGDADGAAVIAGLALLSGGLQLRQERRSERAAAALRAMTVTTATVVRRASAAAAPVAREVPVDQVVPGDIVRLAAADLVPADLWLLRADALEVSQAILTGESLPVAKQAAATCLMGTSVTGGSGTGVVLATGPRTCLGALNSGGPARRALTAFDASGRSVSGLLACFMIVCVPAVFAVSAVAHGHVFEALLFAVAVAVGITPEMLPVVVTAALARGAGVMAGQGAIVKRLPAIHDLGAMDVLCADKTGTLTEDLVSLDCHLDPSGRPDPEVLRWACVNAHAAAEYSGEAIGDVLDEALLKSAAELGIPAGDLPVIDVVPLDFSRRRVTSVVREASQVGHVTLVTKGSVEQVLSCCTRIAAGGGDLAAGGGDLAAGGGDLAARGGDLAAGGGDRLLGSAERAELRRLAESRARDGVRLLAVALARRPPRLGGYRPADEAGMTLIGFVGFRDVPRPGVAEALAALAGHGVSVKVITGDDPLVAARICRDVGVDPGVVVTGADIGRLRDEELAYVAAAATVFARVDPAQKARIVRALRSGGAVAGFLGDGVNDLAALTEADVGISAEGAVPVARECAEVILLRKDLALLARAVIEGRRTFGNISKYLKITLASNFGNAMSMLAASALLPFLPMLPLQVLTQNLCFDVCQVALAVDRVDERSLRRPCRFDARDLARFVLCLGSANTLADLATLAVLWRITGGHAGPAGQALLRSAWFAENLVTQAVAVHLLRSRALPSFRNHAAGPVLLATLALALAGLCLPLSPLAVVLHMRALPLAYLPLLAAVVGGFCVATLAALSLYRRAWPRP
jgi:P-type Mg2+ transporter